MTPFTHDDVWLAALNALPSDPRPIAALLRSDVPLPDWIRYELADAMLAMVRQEPSFLDAYYDALADEMQHSKMQCGCDLCGGSPDDV